MFINISQLFLYAFLHLQFAYEFFLAKMASSKKAGRKMLVKLDSIKGSRSALFAAGAGVSIFVLIMALVLPGMTFYFSQNQTAVLQLIFFNWHKPLFYIILIFSKLALSLVFQSALISIFLNFSPMTVKYKRPALFAVLTIGGFFLMHIT